MSESGANQGGADYLVFMVSLLMRLRTAALLFLLNAVPVFLGTATAGPASVGQHGPAHLASAVLAGNTQAALMPVQLTNTNSVMPTNIFSGQLNFTNGAVDLAANVFTVPAGKRLVIEFVSAVFVLQSTQHVLTLTVDGLQALPNFTGNRNDGSAIFAVSQPLRDTLSAGRNLVVAAERDSNSGVGTVFVNVIAQLEDAP